jgi:hypothetical protein
VANPIVKYGYAGKGRAALRVLRSEVLDRTLLRRTKVQQADVLALPPRTIGESVGGACPCPCCCRCCCCVRFERAALQTSPVGRPALASKLG